MDRHRRRAAYGPNHHPPPPGRLRPSRNPGLSRWSGWQIHRPRPSGSPSRGRLDVLPTGRNFFSVDNRAVPPRWSGSSARNPRKAWFCGACRTMDTTSAPTRSA
ncbi:MAG: cobaltochelatase subunit CobN [Candidatus Devosia euplotis]|nr:cobaltochelatase subunit CobN [Candidatus Devosia euplotis]